MKHQGGITNTLNNTPREYWKNSEFAWISIPKNANMQFRQICKSLKAERQKNNGTYPDTVVCVWRDPRTRLISGLGEFHNRKHRRNKKPFTLDVCGELLEQLLENPVSFDEHLEPQTVFAGGIAYSHVLRFENLREEMMRVPVFANNRGAWHTRLNGDRLKKSKHTRNFSLEDALKTHYDIIEQVVHKYYAQDQNIHENPTILETLHRNPQ